MSFGTLFTHNPNPRSTAILAVAKANGLHLDIVYAEKSNPEAFEKLCSYNPLGTVPTLVTADGYVLTECIAITLYITSKSDTTTLLGSSQRDYFDILQWMSFANSDLLPAIGGCLLPLIGRRQIIRQDVGDSLQALQARCRRLEDHLLRTGKYLTGDKLTIADFFLAGILTGAYMGFSKVLKGDYPELTRWFYGVFEMDMFKAVAGDMQHFDLPMPVVQSDL